MKTKSKQLILNQHLTGVDIGDANDHMLNAMEEYAIQQIEEYKANQYKDEMYLNMQYYMEYCMNNKYVTPKIWIENHKHF